MSQQMRGAIFDTSKKVNMNPVVPKVSTKSCFFLLKFFLTFDPSPWVFFPPLPPYRAKRFPNRSKKRPPSNAGPRCRL